MADFKEHVECAKIAEPAERYDDMAMHMKTFAETGQTLTDEERNLISIAYKNVVGARRCSWRIICQTELQLHTDAEREVARSYRVETIEKELRDLCEEILDLLDNFLIPQAEAAVPQVFYKKMKGDYYRYLAEIATEGERTLVAEKAQQSYQEAYDLSNSGGNADQSADLRHDGRRRNGGLIRRCIGNINGPRAILRLSRSWSADLSKSADWSAFPPEKTKLRATRPIHLGLGLNFSVFYYEILGDVDKACAMTKQTVEDAMANGNLKEGTLRDSTLIIQLLKDNLVLWTIYPQDEDRQNKEDPQVEEEDEQ